MSLLTGGTTYGFSPISFIERPALWFETISKYRGTCTSAPNFAYEYCMRPGQLSEETLEQMDLSSLRILMAAAEPIKADVYRRFLQRFEPYGLDPRSFFVAYGLAENTLAVTNYGRTTLSLSRPALSLGKVHTDQDSRRDCRCHTPHELWQTSRRQSSSRSWTPTRGRRFQKDRIGEIWVSGSSKGQGYWNNPDTSEELFRARLAGDGDGDTVTEYLRTGDMGFFLDGELYVCGRRKDMIIMRGQNYYPQDIETVVEQASSAGPKGMRGGLRNK